MSYKSDIQATRSDAAAGATAIIAQPKPQTKEHK
jgi:hypothetical protein